MSRLPPKPSTIKRLFALSGNICAFPDCYQEMINNDGIVIGEVCHIEAAEEGGERYNVNQNDEERRDFNNLILLCSNHHKETNNTEKFKTWTLKKMKKEHEKDYLGSKDKISSEQIKQVLTKIQNRSYNNLDERGQINNMAKNQNIGMQIGNQTNIYMSDKHENDKHDIIDVRKVDTKLKALIERTKRNTGDEIVIDFRNELNEKFKRKIYLVPIRYLKYRKDNGRIIAEIESYEKLNNCTLNETDDAVQKILKEKLQKNKSEDNQRLKRLLKHKGQKDVAVITSDGFLVNGNRRKLALEELYDESNQNSKFEHMKVVILPDDVTELDVQKFENRCQLQSDGKAEYKGLHKALTYRRNIEKGFPLEAQLKDDANFIDLDRKEFNKAVDKIKKEYLLPLERIDEYLSTFGREGIYDSIGIGENGRWQAFKDYSDFYNGYLKNDKERVKLKIRGNEVGKIENAIFKIIRKRNLNSSEVEKFTGKLHEYVRSSNLKKILENQDSKKLILNLVKIPNDIPNDEKYDKENKRYSEKDIDKKWSEFNNKELTNNLYEASKVILNQSERAKPLELLDDAFKKLTHRNLKFEEMDLFKCKDAIDKIRKIQRRTEEIEEILDKLRGDLQKLKTKQ